MEKKTTQPDNYSLETRLVHGKAHTEAWNFQNHVVPPITSNTTYRLKSVERGAAGFANFGQEDVKESIWVYDRLDEPNNLMLEEQLSFLEGGKGSVTFSSGMGAISAVCLSTLKSGDLVYSDATVYGCTFSLFENWLPKFGLEVGWQNFNNLSFLDNPPENLRLLYFESVANPNLKVADIPKIAKRVEEINKNRAPENKILIAVDNTFATPLACNPLKLGATFSINSLTKNIAGFGTELGGSVTTTQEWITPLKLARKDFGAVLNSKSSWHILNHGIPTLNLRFKAQQKSAAKIANFLKNETQVEKVFYTGLEDHETYQIAKKVLSSSTSNEFNPGFMLAFYLKENEAKTKDFINYIAEKSYTMTLAVSLGLTKSLIEVPRLMTHSVLDEKSSEASQISNKLIRLSIGIENSDDIIKDLKEALNHIL